MEQRLDFLIQDLLFFISLLILFRYDEVGYLLKSVSTLLGRYYLLAFALNFERVDAKNDSSRIKCSFTLLMLL